MQAEVTPVAPVTLPVRHNLTPITAASLLAALLLATASLAGLLYPDTVYPTAALKEAFLVNDIVNLALILPILLVAIGLAGRGRLLGLLFWPGALFAIIYNSIAYVVALPANASFLLNLLLLALSAYTLIALVAAVDAEAVRERLAGRVPEKVAGGALLLWGALFPLIVLGALADPVLNGTPVPAGERALHVADMMIVPALIMGGWLLWQRRPLGYVAGAGLLFQVNLLFVGLIAVFLLQPLVSGAPLPVTDIVVTAAMWLVGLVPLALYVRGIGAAPGPRRSPA